MKVTKEMVLTIADDLRVDLTDEDIKHILKNTKKKTIAVRTHIKEYLKDKNWIDKL